MNWQLLAMFAFGLCPASLFIGAVGMILLLRAMGVRWPWEQPRELEQERGNGRVIVTPSGPRLGDTFTLNRVPEGKISVRTAQLVRWGWQLVGDEVADSTSLHDLHFVWVGEGR